MLMFSLFAVVGITAALYKKYAWNGIDGRPKYVMVATLCGWFLAMSVVVLVPLDVTSVRIFWEK